MKVNVLGLVAVALLAGCASPKARTVVLSDMAAHELREGDLKAARKHLEEAQEISPNDPRVLLNLGVLAHKEANYELARETYLKAINHAWDEKDAKLVDEHGESKNIIEIIKDNLTRLREDEERAAREKTAKPTE